MLLTSNLGHLLKHFPAPLHLLPFAAAAMLWDYNPIRNSRACRHIESFICLTKSQFHDSNHVLSLYSDVCVYVCIDLYAHNVQCRFFSIFFSSLPLSAAECASMPKTFFSHSSMPLMLPLLTPLSPAHKVAFIFLALARWDLLVLRKKEGEREKNMHWINWVKLNWSRVRRKSEML